jgi:hypothetical protein
MRRISRTILILLVLTGSTTCAVADDTDIAPDTKTPVAVDETHPVYSTDARWTASLLIGIGALFLAAYVVGQVVRAESADVVPVAMSHEEDPAADRLGHTDPKTPK